MNNEQPDIKKFPYMKYIIGLLFLLIVIKSQAQYDYVINFKNATHYDLFNRVTWEGKTYKQLRIAHDTLWLSAADNSMSTNGRLLEVWKITFVQYEADSSRILFVRQLTGWDGIKNAAFKFNPTTPELVLAFPARREELTVKPHHQ